MQAKPITCLVGFYTGLTSTSFMKIHILSLKTRERERNDGFHCIKLFSNWHLLLATKYITAIKNSQKPLKLKSIALDYSMFLREGINKADL